MLVMSGVTGIAVDGTFDFDGKARDLLGLTSARGTTKRSGVERIKHVSARHLWSQQTLRKILFRAQRDRREHETRPTCTRSTRAPQ